MNNIKDSRASDCHVLGTKNGRFVKVLLVCIDWSANHNLVHQLVHEHAFLHTLNSAPETERGFALCYA